VSLRKWLTIAALTGVAIVLVLAPPYRGSDWLLYALLIADFIAIGLIARDARALWTSVGFAASCCVAWDVEYFSTNADDGILDGLVLGLIALLTAGAAVAAGLLARRLLR
jgi:hypothetical protein